MQHDIEGKKEKKEKMKNHISTETYSAKRANGFESLTSVASPDHDLYCPPGEHKVLCLTAAHRFAAA